MQTEELKDTLMDLARKSGICLDGYKHMWKSGLEGLIAYYIQNPEWCMERSYPSLDDIRFLVDRDVLASHGIYVDRTFKGELLDDKLKYIFHNCTGNIYVALNYDKEIIPMLYFANGCNMTIGCTQYNFHPISVPVTIFGENTVNFEDTPNARFLTYRKEIL